MDMTIPVGDLEYRFDVDGHSYLIQICGCGGHPAAGTIGPAEVTLITCVREELLDHEDDDPNKVARDAVKHAKRLLPDPIPDEQWEGLYEAVVQWVCEHRAAAAIAHH